MTTPPVDEVPAEQTTARDNMKGIALACGVLGVVSAFLMYWLIVPGVVFGVAAVVLGRLVRRRGFREVGSVAMTLGVVAILLVPAFLSTADNAEEWGRDCALHPESDSHC